MAYIYGLLSPRKWSEFGFYGLPFEAVKSIATANEIYQPPLK